MRAYAAINVRWQLTYIIQIKRHLKHQTAYLFLKEIYTWMFLKKPYPRLHIVIRNRKWDEAAGLPLGHYSAHVKIPPHRQMCIIPVGLSRRLVTA